MLIKSKNIAAEIKTVENKYLISDFLTINTPIIIAIININNWV